VYGATTDQHNILANKWIELVFEDKSGMIWLGSRGGLTKYNPRRGAFTAIQFDPDSPISLSNDTVTAIATDLRNEVWVGTFSGLNKVDRFTNEVERIIPEEEDLEGLSSRITGFLQDESGSLWIGTYRGLFSYDPKSQLFFNETAEGILPGNARIYHMAHGENAIWLSTGQGLLKMDLSLEQQHLFIPLEFSDPEAEIGRVLADRLGQIWMLTRDGLSLLYGS